MHSQTKELYQVLIASLLFLTLLMGLFIISIYRQMRQRLSEYKQQVKREIELIDSERTRISADLHDELGSGLATIGLLLTQVAEKYQHTFLKKAENQVKRQQQKIREIAHNLVPGILTSHGICFALEDFFEEIKSGKLLKIKKYIQLNDRDFHPAQTMHLYRIIREIVTNTLRHAQATELQVHLTQDVRIIHIRILDNGKGFCPQEQMGYKNGLGMQHIFSRITLLDAKIKLETAPAKGTYYDIKIPVKSMTENNGKKL